MPKLVNAKGIALSIIFLLAVDAGFMVCTNPHIFSSSSDQTTEAASLPVHPEVIPKPHWPGQAYFSSAPGRRPASRDMSKFAEHAVNRELAELRSKKFDEKTLSQVRVLGIDVNDSLVYFHYATVVYGEPFRAWKKVTYLQDYAFPNDPDGAYVAVRLKEPYDSPTSPPAEFVFYANRGYKP